VALDFQAEAISATVEDDGSGFDIKEVQNPAQRQRGLGLSTIQERTEMMGGQVLFESRIGRGSKIRIEIPVALEE
jgi:two-component system sensor histidine kinase DegS